MLCTQTDVEQRFQIDFANDTEPVIVTLIAAAQGHIEREYGGPIEAGTYTDEIHTATYRSAIFLHHHPVTAITSITEDGTALVATDYVWDADGTVHRLDSAGRLIFWRTYKFGGVLVTYDAGYAEADIPEDIRDVCALMVGTAFQRGAAFASDSGVLEGVESEQIGTHILRYMTSLGDPTQLVVMTDEQRDVIREYRLGSHRRVGFGVA